MESANHNDAMLEGWLESRVIRKNFDILVTSTQANREQIAMTCYAKDLISQNVLNTGGMREIIQTIQEKVTSNRSRYPFETFLQILNDEPSTERLAEILREDLKEVRRIGTPMTVRLKKSSLVCSPSGPTLPSSAHFTPQLMFDPLSRLNNAVTGIQSPLASDECHSFLYTNPTIDYRSSGTSDETSTGSEDLQSSSEYNQMWPKMEEESQEVTQEALTEGIKKCNLQDKAAKTRPQCTKAKQRPEETTGRRGLNREGLKVKLREMKRKNKKQARRMEKMERRLKELAALERENEQHKEKLFRLNKRMQYMESYMNDAQADRVAGRAELLAARGEVLELRERERDYKEKIATLEKAASRGYQLEMELGRQREKVRTLENLLWRPEVFRRGKGGPSNGGGFDEPDGIGTGVGTDKVDSGDSGGGGEGGEREGETSGSSEELEAEDDAAATTTGIGSGRGGANSGRCLLEATRADCREFQSACRGFDDGCGGGAGQGAGVRVRSASPGGVEGSTVPRWKRASSK